jgi:hypothetical protein
MQPMFVKHEKLTKLEPGSLLLDASTVSFLNGHTVYHALTGPYFADARVAEVLHAVLARQAAGGKVEKAEESDLYALTHALSFLEQWMLADKLVVDGSAVSSLAQINASKTRREQFSKLSVLYTQVWIPQDLTRQAADNVVAFGDLLRDPNNPLHLVDLDLPLKDDYYNRIRFDLGVSGNVPARALFYLELSRLLEGPLLLHPEKSKYLQKISQGITSGLTVIYKSLVDKLQDALEFKEFNIPIPPIADEILRTARNEKCSLIDAAVAIRESKEISSLRSVVWELKSFAAGRQRIRYEREIAERTKEIADAVESRAVAGGRISRRTLNLAEVPAIGPVFKVLGGGEITVPDLVLFEKPYIALFSRWANEFHPSSF